MVLKSRFTMYKITKKKKKRIRGRRVCTKVAMTEAKSGSMKVLVIQLLVLA